MNICQHVARGSNPSSDDVFFFLFIALLFTQGLYLCICYDDGLHLAAYFFLLLSDFFLYRARIIRDTSFSFQIEVENSEGMALFFTRKFCWTSHVIK